MAVTNLASVKAELHSWGVRVDGHDGFSVIARKGGAGPAEGITLVLGGSPASVPLRSSFVASSPYSIACEDAQWTLIRHGERVCTVDVPGEPRFYGMRTSEGIPYRKIALLHGKDCLASTVLQHCDYWGTPAGCTFCGIGLSLSQGQTLLVKKPDDLAQVAQVAGEEGVTHVTLTAGSTFNREQESDLYIRCTRAMAHATGFPVHVQLLPPISRARMEALKDAGVTSLGIHVESFDASVLHAYAPCKGDTSIAEYHRAWREAVNVFGRGQVSSFILLGLGEDRDSLVENVIRLAEEGIYPFLVPFRPIPGTPLAGVRPPDPQACKELYEEVALILKEHRLSWRQVSAGCVRCRGCSALPDFEDLLGARDQNTFTETPARCIVAHAERDIKECSRIRHEVFVEEQGFRSEDDQDGLDPVSVHILALADQTPVGTVRITPMDDHTWLGSRLAVLKPFRGGCGPLLVKRAQEEVRIRGGRRFIAYVQVPRVPFFERCGWRCIQEIPDYHGRPHMLMETSIRPVAAEPQRGERRKGQGQQSHERTF